MGVCVCSQYLARNSHPTHSEVKFCLETKALKTCFQLIQVTLFGLKSGLSAEKKNSTHGRLSTDWYGEMAIWQRAPCWDFCAKT